MTDELHCCCLAAVPCVYRHIFLCIRSTAVGVKTRNRQSLNSTEVVFHICRENLCQWEKISRGEVEDIVPSRPYDSGPVKVDN